MKTISIIIPTYNEEQNISVIYDRIKKVFEEKLSGYQYEIVYIDNHSEDSSPKLIRKLCSEDNNVKAIFNARNFGFNRSTFYGLMQGTGDCTILIFADMQDPPEVIPDFVKEWEQGWKIVTGIKTQSKENKLVYCLRTLFYRVVKSISEIDHIDHYDGFGLYDRSFIDVLKSLNDPLPYLRGIVAELGYDRKDVLYCQEKRKLGKSKFNFMKIYDLAMLGITSYSKVVMRLATIAGFIMSILSFIIGCVTLIIKLCNWNYFDVGVAALSVGMFFIGSIILFYIGFQGEYILNMNTRIMDRPLVIEKERVNFGEK